MSLTGFMLAFTGIIIGLGVADLLTSFHKLLRASGRVRWDWLTLLYAAYMLFGMIVFWWWQFGYPGEGKTLTVLQFLPNFLFLALSFLMVASALPDEVPAEGLDLREFYLGTVRHRWGLLTISLFANLIGLVWISLRYGAMDWIGIPLVLICALLSLLALKWRSAWFHVLVLIWLFGVSGASILMRAIAP